MTKQRARVQRGVPTGGQFATQERGEVELALDPIELQEQARTSARRYARRHGADAEELEQQGLLEYLAAVQRIRENPEMNGRTLITGSKDSERAYIDTMIRQISSKMVTPNLTRSEDRKANRILRQRVDERVQTEGRELSDIEIDQMAEELRLEMEPRRRPSEGFHQRSGNMTVGLDAGLYDTLPDDTPDLGDEDSDYDQFESKVLAGDTGKRDAQDQVWDVIAARSGAPTVVKGALSEEKAAKHRKLVGKHGANRLAVAWRKGVIRPEQEEALFAPYGGKELSDADRSKVCSELESRGKRGHQLWDAAVGASTRRRR